MRELMIGESIFIGFKVDNQLRERLSSLGETERKYVSSDSSTFLRLCGAGDDLYIGKVVDERLTTDWVEDIRLHVLSLIRKVGHDTRLPTHLQILACSSGDGARTGATGRSVD